jgi:hypothetical protein
MLALILCILCFKLAVSYYEKSLCIYKSKQYLVTVTYIDICTFIDLISEYFQSQFSTLSMLLVDHKDVGSIESCLMDVVSL